jgi:hypothetical protein
MGSLTAPRLITRHATSPDPEKSTQVLVFNSREGRPKSSTTLVSKNLLTLLQMRQREKTNTVTPAENSPHILAFRFFPQTRV